MNRLSPACALCTIALLIVFSFEIPSAQARQPTNAAPLLGTLVNIAKTGGLAEVVITDVSGNFQVHPFASCSPTFCDWGSHPALRFSSAGISSNTAGGFQVTVATSVATRYLQGHLIRTPTGQTLLEVTTQSKFTNVRDFRYDYELVERFRLK